MEEQRKQSKNLEKQLGVDREKLRLELMPCFDFVAEKEYKYRDHFEDTIEFYLINVGALAYGFKLIQPTNTDIEIVRGKEGAFIIRPNKELYFKIGNQTDKRLSPNFEF